MSQIKGPVDLVFLDADKEGYADYLKQLLLLLRCGGTVIAHNIEPGEGRRRPGEARTATRASG